MKKIFTISFLALIIDQIIKILVSFYLPIGKSSKIINNFFYLTYVKNTGAAFSMLKGYRFILIIITIVFLIFLYKYLQKINKFTTTESICYGLLLGGVLGNLFDRIIYGYVIDYLDFLIISYDFPIFNLADTFIVCSCFLLLIKSFKEDIKHEN